MKYLVKIFGLFVFLTALIFNAKSKQIHKWEVQPIVFTANGQYSNPYAEIPDPKSEDLLRVTFKGVDGEAKDKIIEIVGFWDGGNEWKVNFAAPCTGTWEYASSSDDKGLNGVTETIEVAEWSDEELEANPVRRGFIRVNRSGKNAGHLDMGEAAVGKQFSFYWYNPATGESTSERKITGGRKVQFTAPEMYPATLDYSDWVLHVFENYE